MLRAIFFAIKVLIVIALAVWVTRQPGVVEINWLGYNITAHIGLVLFSALVFIIVLLFLHRIYLWIARLPAFFKNKKSQANVQKGISAVTRGLTAVASGDADASQKMALEARRYLPHEKGLTLLLEAQSARLKGDEVKANECFQALLNDKNASFLGIRGLLSNALAEKDHPKALEYARKGLDMNPRQPWIIRTVYDLEVQAQEWENAAKTLQRAMRYKAIDPEQGKKDQMAMILYQSDIMAAEGDDRKALQLAKKALKMDGGFTPAALYVARLLQEKDNKRAAIKVIETAWKAKPHPDLVSYWDALAPEKAKNNPMQRLRWFEKLVAWQPDSDQSQLAAASAAIDGGLWGEARQYLDRAQSLRESAALYKLFAQLYENTSQPEQARICEAKAWDAPADPVWVCRKTGRIYEQWSPLAKPHDSFNTIIWGFPQNAMMSLPFQSNGQDDFLAPDILLSHKP